MKFRPIRKNDPKDFELGCVRIRSRGRLPHCERNGGTYFVTFRLADSLPREVQQQIRRLIEFERKIAVTCTLDSSAGVSPVISPRGKESARILHKYLDRGFGQCLLRNSSAAQIVETALLFANGDRYQLLSWCVMPNHVHVVLRLAEGQELSSVVHSWKSYSAHQMNKLMGHSGPVWQREYYDRLLRAGEIGPAIKYVLDNPVKAALQDWNWVGYFEL